MARPNGDPAGSPDIVDDALRLVGAVRRRLIVAGVRRGVASATGGTPRTPDVWEQAVREEQRQDEPALDQLLGIVRTKGPEVAGHLGRAGVVLVGALGETWTVIGRSIERAQREREERERAGATEPTRRPG
ncbi:hypothetical protein [Marinactinospora rubrisoli]|uniref:Uncharacterized protein n=1 Tax=Marinactinospora rubrisoli TaxID=2715399 RepID=A0ABW2KLT8_9ACTN